jgi:leucyl-tRNA synthetase
MANYNHTEIESKWTAFWQESQIYQTSEIQNGDSKKYILDMFPYPSGAGLHVGHPRGYVATDILSRFYRARGFKVLHPMGWDAFGLPAEQYAVKTGTHPRLSTQKNIQTFKKQLQSLGLSYDWQREIDTTDPNYYKWTQWIFLRLFEKGLAYQSETAVNWCPELGTILANEEVVNDKSEVGGFPVISQPIRQWLLRITEYAERLNDDLKLLPNWPSKVRAMQANWIGKSEGLVFRSPVENSNLVLETFSAHFEAFSADTFVVIAPDHPLLPELVKGVQNEQEILDFCQRLSHRKQQEIDTEKEIEGIFTGRYTLDPVGNGKLPIWVASFAIASYGTGIIKCSAHDPRDFAFAKKYNIPLKTVLFPEDRELAQKVKNQETCFSDMTSGILREPVEFDGKIAGKVRQEIIDYCFQKGFAKTKTVYKLRDWVFSRQRFWGEPIPLVFEADENWQIQSDAKMLDESELPLKLPEVEDFRRIAVDKTQAKPEPVLARFPDWVNVWGYCLPNGKVKIVPNSEISNYETAKNPFLKESPLAGDFPQNTIKNDFSDNQQPQLRRFVRETNTMPQWAGSSWYWLRFMDPSNGESFCQTEKLWGQVDIYVGGAEHAVLHLLYSRFWHKVLFDLGLVSNPEPFEKLINQGLIMAEDGQKMSKSLGNVVNPDEIIAEFGADALRLYEMFLGPFEQSISWSSQAIVGVRRFLEKFWNLQTRLYLGEKSLAELEKSDINWNDKTEHAIEIALQNLIKKVSEDIENAKFNTCVSEFMKFVNLVEKTGAITFAQLFQATILLAPFAPFLCEEIYQNLVKIYEKENVSFKEKLNFKPKKSVHLESFPTYKEISNLDEKITIAVQINGKVRGTVEVDPEMSSQKVQELVLAQDFVQKYLPNGQFQKLIYVPKKVVSLVV